MTDIWQQALDFVDAIGNHIFAISMLGAAITVTHRKVIRPIVRAAKTVHDRWDNIKENDELLEKVVGLLESINNRVSHIEGISTEHAGRLDQIENHLGGSNSV